MSRVKGPTTMKSASVLVRREMTLSEEGWEGCTWAFTKVTGFCRVIGGGGGSCQLRTAASCTAVIKNWTPDKATQWKAKITFLSLLLGQHCSTLTCCLEFQADIYLTVCVKTTRLKQRSFCLWTCPWFSTWHERLVTISAVVIKWEAIWRVNG